MLSDKILYKLIGEAVVSIDLIDKGWSNDQKFIIQTNQSQYLIRCSKIDLYTRKLKEYRYMKKVYENGVNSQKPLALIKDEKNVYILLPYIKGTDLEKHLPKLDDITQYNYGVDSGVMLTKIHSVIVDENIEPWYDRFSQKVLRNIKRYKECGVSFEGSEVTIKFLIDHMDILKNRPQTFMHGDYHVGNMLLDSNNKLAVIDFNRMDFGDPYEEFNRLIAFTKKASISFAKGQIDGYFNYQVPDEFFTYLAFYTASNTLGSIPWAISFGQNEINVMLAIAKTVLSDFKNFTQLIPDWYKTK